MSELVDFIKENYISIAVIVSVIFALLIIISIREWDLNPPKPESKLVQEIVVETFESISMINQDPNKPNELNEINNLKLNPSDSFCESHLGNSAKLETSCAQLTQENCSQPKCCVWLEQDSESGGRCAAGSKDGPTYAKDKDGKLITIDSYYYQGRKMVAPTSM
jgi:hypothetical protein